MTRLSERLNALPAATLQGMRRGVEKESLRIDAQGKLALTPHPPALGSPLTHGHITTDYSESQLELITGVHDSVEACERELVELHQFTYRVLYEAGGESMWVGSMPCGLPSDENIPIGRYGTSNIGRAKSIYRMGLSHRYGRRMQTISGIHYNWSLPGLTSADYFALIRNFRRQSFLLLTLFGASPAVCPSFVEGRDHGLQKLSEHTLYLPYATTLRMGRLGYQSDAQASIAASFNDLECYAASLHEALTRPHPDYERIGVRNLGGEYNQLTTSLLQIENEFYGTIRPKRVIRRGERPLHALRERGVEYVEVRCMDLDPFEPVGIRASTMRFLDTFLLYCLLDDSPPDTPAEVAQIARNQQLVASAGRDPALRLERGAHSVSLTEWAGEILAQMAPIAALLDRQSAGEPHHQAALRDAERRLAQPKSLPSARVIDAVRSEHDGAYTQFGRHCARLSREHVLALPYDPAVWQRLQADAAASIEAQRVLEAADTLPFETWRQRYLDAATLTPQPGDEAHASQFGETV